MISPGLASAATLASAVLALTIRLLYLVYYIVTTECSLESQNASLRTILCIGSGGHTTELLRLMKNLDPVKYCPRMYILADNDVSSEVKIHVLEKDLKNINYTIRRIPRSRNVKQSYFSSICTTLYSILYTIPLIFKFKPEIVLCNGPGTCIPVCVIAFLMRCLFIVDCRIVFIESVCRVRTFSLSGKILQFFADVVIVQWPFLRDVCPRSKYFGRLT